MKPKTILFTDDNEEIELPTCWEICDNCDGEGTHMHEAIRSHAYTAEEFYEEYPEDEEREAYFGGGYDVRCDECGGSGKVKAVDRKLLAKQDPELLRAWDQQCEEDAQYYAICEMERKMGA